MSLYSRRETRSNERLPEIDDSPHIRPYGGIVASCLVSGLFGEDYDPRLRSNLPVLTKSQACVVGSDLGSSDILTPGASSSSPLAWSAHAHRAPEIMTLMELHTIDDSGSRQTYALVPVRKWPTEEESVSEEQFMISRLEGLPAFFHTLIPADYDHAAALWLIDFMLWSDEAGITIRCSHVSINGQPLDVPPW